MATEEPERPGGTLSRPGTARALVLLASALSLAAGAVVCFIALVFGPVLTDRRELTTPIVLAVVVFMAITVLAVVLANVLAVRGATTRGVLAVGCGTLLVGIVLAIAALLLLISANS